MPQAKLIIKRGQVAADVAQSAGSAIAGGGGDAIEVNFDTTNMSEREAWVLLVEIGTALLNRPWPMTA